MLELLNLLLIADQLILYEMINAIDENQSCWNSLMFYWLLLNQCY